MRPVAEAGEKFLTAAGRSMSMTMDPGDQAEICLCGPEELKPGEIAVLLKWNEQMQPGYITHRVLMNSVFRGRRLFITKGDANFLPDLPSDGYRPVGKVAAIHKNGACFSPVPRCWPAVAVYSAAASNLLWACLFLAARIFALLSFARSGFGRFPEKRLWPGWETRLYSLTSRALSLPVYRCLRTLPGAAAAPPQQVKIGIIFSDETWSGRVVVMDHLCVAPGAAVTALPGTEILFESSGDHPSPLAYVKMDGPPGADSMHAKILVYGRFRALGEPGRPVKFGGDSMGGIYALGMGKVQLSHFSISGAAIWAAQASDRAELDCRDGNFSGCNRGICADGASAARLARCVFSGGETALRALHRASVLACGVKVSGCTGFAAEVAGSARLSLSGCVMEGGQGGALVSGGRLRARACRFENNADGIVASGGRMRVGGSVFGRNARGIVVFDSRLRAARCRFELNAEAVLASGRSALELDALEISGTPYPCIAARPPAELRAAGVTADGLPWLRPEPPARPARGGGRLFRFAAATYRLRPFSWLYKRIYLLGPAVAARLLSLPEVKSLYLYRGMSGAGWVPALSDMDLACLAAPMTPAADLDFHLRLRRRERALKKLLPFTGEVMAARSGELQDFMSGWGVKGREFYASSRLLAGAPPRRPPAPDDGQAADLTEAFYAYTILSQHFFSSGRPRAFVRRNCLKNRVDVERYLDTASPLRDSRRAYAAAAGLDLDAFASCPEQESAFAAFGALHRAAERLLPLLPASAAPSAAGAAAPHAGHTPFETACGELREACGGAGFVLDALYRLYVVLPDSCAGDSAAFGRAAAAVARACRAGSQAARSPMLISAAAFGLLPFTAYLNNPLFWLDLSGSAEGGGGFDPADGALCRCAFAPAPRRPADALIRANSVLALRHFAATWRSQWEGMPAHYFYSRAAGLRLLAAGSACPAFSDVRALSAAFRASFGAGLPDWETFRGRGSGGENYKFVAAQVAAARGRDD